MNDDLRRRLEEAGSRPAPPPGPAFADALEARLRAVHASLPADAPGANLAADAVDGPLELDDANADAGDRRRGTLLPLPGTTGAGAPRPDGARRRWGLALLGAAGAAVPVVGVLVLVLLQRPAAPPELVAPVNVEVSLAGGTTLDDPEGLVLPEGAVIRVGEGGSARIGDVVLGPGDTATVRDGRLEVERAGSGGVPEPTPRATTLAQRTAAPSPHPVPSASPTRGPAASGTPSPSRSPRPSPSPTTAPPTSTPNPTPPPTGVPPTATPAPTPTPTPTPAIVRPTLRARVVLNTRYWVTWTSTFRARKYVLIVTMSRGGTAAFPAYPGARILGTYATPPATRLRFRVPLGVTQIKLRVIALRGNGTVLRRSNIVTLTVTPTASSAPPPATPTPSPDPTAAPTASP